MLKLANVINHLFGEEQFARCAGTRSQAMLDSQWDNQLDTVHGKALTALASNVVDTAEVQQSCSDAVGTAPRPASLGIVGEISDAEQECVDPDPTDEVMTGNGDSLTLLFALFVDGVQLHDHGRATTTVMGLKCLDLPAFLSSTDLACFPLAYIGGSKEPSNLSEFMMIVLQQFKSHEPLGVDENGCSTMFTFWLLIGVYTSKSCPLRHNFGVQAAFAFKDVP